MAGAKSKKKREDKPTRYRKARGDASIATIQRTLENKFGLPEGGVRLVYPSGRKARSDSNVELLIKSWEKRR